jgi:transcriptional regulator GlxA family with amidase domain
VAEVGILLYDDVEVLDCCGPFEVFSTASRVALRRGWPGPPFRVYTIGAGSTDVVARGGLRLVASCALGGHPPLDVLVVPGGLQERTERDRRVITWLAAAAETATVTASVCTGAFLLAAARLLDGRQATTHWEDVDDLERRFPSVTVRRGVRWVDEGQVVTSAGISAGLDMSLHVVGRLEGVELAEATARQMEYHWRDDSCGAAPP